MQYSFYKTRSNDAGVRTLTIGIYVLLQVISGHELGARGGNRRWGQTVRTNGASKRWGQEPGASEQKNGIKRLGHYVGAGKSKVGTSGWTTARGQDARASGWDQEEGAKGGIRWD